MVIVEQQQQHKQQQQQQQQQQRRHVALADHTRVHRDKQQLDDDDEQLDRAAAHRSPKATTTAAADGRQGGHRFGRQSHEPLHQKSPRTSLNYIFLFILSLLFLLVVAWQIGRQIGRFAMQQCNYNHKN